MRSLGHDARASEVSDAVLRAVVFPALRVVPFDPKPGPRRAVHRASEPDCPDMPGERDTRAELWRTGGPGHRLSSSISVVDPKG